MKRVRFWLKLPIFLALAPIVWMITRRQYPGGGRQPRDTWTAFCNWLKGSPPGYRYPREDEDERIDLRPYER